MLGERVAASAHEPHVPLEFLVLRKSWKDVSFELLSVQRRSIRLAEMMDASRLAGATGGRTGVLASVLVAYAEQPIPLHACTRYWYVVAGVSPVFA